MFELRDLFGGAICAHMPENAVDIRFVVNPIINLKIQASPNFYGFNFLSKKIFKKETEYSFS